MKKLLGLAMIGVICFSLAGCYGDQATPQGGSSATSQTSKPTPSGDPSATTPGKTDDGKKAAPTGSGN